MDFLDSFGFTLPGLEMLAKEGSWDELINSFSVVGRAWVIWSCHIFMMTVNVLLKEVRVHELCVGKSAKQLVVPFTLVNEFMSYDGIESGEVTKDESKLEPLSQGVRLDTVEPGTFNVYRVTADHEGPDPNDTFQSNVGVKWIVKPLVFEEGLFTILVEIFIFLLSEMIFQWP